MSDCKSGQDNMNARVLSVYDEGAIENTPYIGAKGFAVLVEVDGQRTLFDVGMRGRYLLHNLDFLEIKPETIDRVVISHNHRPNIGALSKLIESRTEPLDIFVNTSFQSVKRMFGRPFFSEEIAPKANIHVMEGNTKFSDHLMSVGPFGDLQEFSLVLDSLNGPVVISSCYHCGVRPVLTEVYSVTGKEPCHLIGGLHIMRARQKNVDPTAEVIKDFGSPHMTMGHCADEGAKTYLRVRFNIKGVDDFYVGTSVDLKVRER